MLGLTPIALHLAYACFYGADDSSAIFALLAAICVMAVQYALSTEGSVHLERQSRWLPAREARARIFEKTVALYVLFVGAGLLWARLPYFQDGVFGALKPYIDERAGAVLIAVIPVYVYFSDCITKQPADSYSEFGKFILSLGRYGCRRECRKLLSAWAIKMFFWPLMISGFLSLFREVTTANFSGLSWPQLVAIVSIIAYYFDVAFASIGYLVTARWLGGEIRSVCPTGLGIAVCLICYKPFWPMIYDNFLASEDNIVWSDWLSAGSLLSYAWGSAIMIALGIYAWASVSFGYRFSNLTNRGIITAGPYRWTKHPAYISKNISWWLVAVPFISNQGPAAAVTCCVMLGANSYVYYLRARHEERHLREETAYQQYERFIAQHGAIARVRAAAREILGLYRWKADLT